MATGTGNPATTEPDERRCEGNVPHTTPRAGAVLPRLREAAPTFDLGLHVPWRDQQPRERLVSAAYEEVNHGPAREAALRAGRRVPLYKGFAGTKARAESNKDGLLVTKSKE